MHQYLVVFNGYGERNSVYPQQEIVLQLRHDWSKNVTEASNVLDLVHLEIKKHFQRYKLISVEEIAR